MNKTRRILFVSAPIGSGHVRAARAVGAALLRKAPDIDVRYADVFDFFSPALGKLLLRAYLKTLAVFPQAYGAAYGWGNSSPLAGYGREVVSRCLAARMRDYIAATRPAAVVCTHATPAGLVACLRRRGELSAPAVAVVTDFVVHRLWVYPEFDAYCVADDGLLAFLRGHGVDVTRSRAFGIPVAGEFAAPADRTAVMAGLGLREDMPVVLMMGGGAGVVPMDEIALALEAAGLQLQLVAVAGANAALRGRLEALRPRLANCRLKVTGFVDNVHELMTAADLLISKPGGMTSAEALCRGLPQIIFRPIPGQEEANARYLTASAVACRAESGAEAARLTALLLRDEPAKLGAMRAGALALGRPGAADDIAAHILTLAEKLS